MNEVKLTSVESPLLTESTSPRLVGATGVSGTLQSPSAQSPSTPLGASLPGQEPDQPADWSSCPPRLHNHRWGSLELSWAAVSVAGNHRPTNQDAVVAAPPVFVVADGMGGHQFGEQASAAVVAAMTPLIGRRDLTVESIRQALDWAQQEIDQLTVRASTGQSRPANRTIRTAGATVAGLVLVRQDDQWQWLVVNVGDCRVYRLTEDDCEQITVDHTEVQELLDQGAISPAEVALHPRRHVVTRALGAGSEAEPDYWLLAPGGRERWLICSDGLSGELPADVVAAALEYDGEADQAATALLAAALRSRGRDNVSIIVVDAVFDPTTPAVPPLSRDSRMGTAQPCSSRSARTVPRI